MKFEDLVILLPCQSLEDFSLDREAADAEQILSAYSALWHPAMLVSAQDVPKWVRAEEPPADPAGHLVMVPDSCDTMLPAGWIEEARAAGACVVHGLEHRDEMVAAALAQLDGGSGGVDAELARDFLALGFGHLLVELLTRQLRYMSNLDEVRFSSETVGAAEAALKGGAESAREQLRSAFEQLTEAREYFYPVEAYLVDLTLVAPTTLGGTLREELARKGPTNLLISGADIERMAEEEPETLSALKAGVTSGTVSLIGGGLDDHPLPLVPMEALVEHFQQGLSVYERRLGCRPTIFGRRRFGLTPVLPQLLHLLGFEGACHFTLDDGRFPASNQSRVRWEGVDGTVVEALSRLPLDVTRSDNFLRLPEKLGDALDLDHTATAVMAHWPGESGPWYEDIQRVAEYSPVLGRFVSAKEYFQETNLSGQQQRYGVDRYRSPYLRQDVAGGRADPISRWARYHGRRARLDAARALRCLASLIAGRSTTPKGEVEGEEEILRGAVNAALTAEGGEDSQLDGRLEASLTEAAQRLSGALPRSEAKEQPGILLFNPWIFSRREWIDAGAVEIPPMGFAWVGSGHAEDPPPQQAPRKRWLSRKPRPEPPMAEDHVLRNEFFEVAINPTTGGIQSLHDYRHRENRLAQQIALRMPDPTHRDGFSEAGADSDYSVMAADEIVVEAAGPVVAAIVCRGRLLDRRGKRLAGYQQTTRVRRGSRVMELEIELDVDRQPEANPWDSYYAARFAWADATADLVRSVNQVSRPTDGSRLEAPHFVDVRGATTRTTILAGGLPYHRKFGLRKLDTLLVVRGEKARSFRLGVGVDLGNPMPAAMDFLVPQAIAVERAGPPTPPSAWLFHLDTPNVIATHWEPVTTDGRTDGYRIRLLETEGRRVEAALRSFRAVRSAQRIDFGRETPSDLTVAGDRVGITLGPHQFTQIEVRLVM